MKCAVTLTLLTISLSACSGTYGLYGLEDFTPEEQADIKAAVQTWEAATPQWRGHLHGGIQFSRAPEIVREGEQKWGWTYPGTWWAPTASVTLVPKDVVGDRYQAVVVHELGHAAGLIHRNDDTPSVMHPRDRDNADKPTMADVIALIQE